MALLDFHVHVCRRYDWNPPVIEFVEEANPDFYCLFPEEVTRDGLLQYFDAEGVDKAVILAEYAPKTSGVVSHDFVHRLCRGSDRLIPFGCISVDAGFDPGSEAERCITELGFRGLKIMPSYCHFYPDDPRMMPAYEVARDLRVPVMFHTGTSLFPGSRIRYANPLLLDDLADELPDLSIVMCHGGRPFWYREAEWMLRRHRNTYIDLAGIPPKHLPEIFPKLESLRDRFLFGSDWPAAGPMSRQAREIRGLPFGPGTVEAILWKNGARLLGLE